MYRILFLFLIFINFVNAQTDSCATPIPNVTLQEAAPYGDPSNLFQFRKTSMRGPLRLFIHVVKYDNGSGGISQADITTAIQNLNEAFLPANINFYQFGLDEIKNGSMLFCVGGLKIFTKLAS